MADVLPQLETLVPAGGALALLAVLYVRLLVHQRTDRVDARSELATARRRIVELEAEVETQRRLRWAAEDAAAKYRRRLGLDGADDGA